MDDQLLEVVTKNIKKERVIFDGGSSGLLFINILS